MDESNVICYTILIKFHAAYYLICMLMLLFSALVLRIQLNMYSFETYYTYLFPKLARSQLRYTWVNSLKTVSVPNGYGNSNC